MRADATANLKSAERYVTGGDRLPFGRFNLEVLLTPGHSPGGLTYLVGNHCFTGDTLLPGRVGRVDIPGASPQQMVTDIFGANANPVSARVFTDTVGALNKLLTITAKVLPDLDQFRVTEDIERGISISGRSLIDAGMVLLTFGTVLLIFAYLLLRKKEVAP